ncbi:putative thiazole-containing bacteriocin maturation protein [Siminovitchia sp. FSL H7-0308]|uniref:putative thiazole-containing bacteriocin maturation protein n=1 Tax=Siminovitchia sp. FSL H7-0308 TaxID=2921432 RepID=UPI0030EF2F52
MPNVTPDMRLKVKRDTFFLPDSNNSVYFRNNVSSFRMEGSAIDQWIEKLLPMFNGEYTLEDLTEELPGSYRDRIYEIAEVLYRNGYVRDVSQDLPHQLMDQVVKEYASQIEFLDSLGGSGANRFQTYRQSKVLAVGSGPFFVSLVSSLLQSGLPKFQMLMMDTVPTNRQRLKEIVAHSCKTDSEVEVEEIRFQKEGISAWREVVQPFDFILYVSQEGDIEELRVLHTICREEKKTFFPAICQQHVGLAGPLVRPDSKGCWESAWRRVHRTVFSGEQQAPGFSATACAMLANVMVFDLFKEITRVAGTEPNNQFYLLDLNTLEGNWYSFFPHPLVAGRRLSAEWVRDLELRRERKPDIDVQPDELLLYFDQLTSEESGIFHIWDEGDLKQLPLAQCRVQVADILSEGPAEVLPEIVCTGLTHEEARREAGLAGIEAYVSQAVDLLDMTPSFHEVEESAAVQEFIGVGAGETFVEGVCRGLQRCLDEELNKQRFHKKMTFTRLQLAKIEDERCRFYLESLATMQGMPIIGLGEEVAGFPLVWVGTKDNWFGSVDLNITMALRKALQQVLMKAQNKEASLTLKTLKASSILMEEKIPLRLEIPACEKITGPDIRSAMQVLERNNKRLLVFDLALEPFLKEGIAGVFGVLLREEGSR